MSGPVLPGRFSYSPRKDETWALHETKKGLERPRRGAGVSLQSPSTGPSLPASWRFCSLGPASRPWPGALLRYLPTEQPPFRPFLSRAQSSPASRGRAPQPPHPSSQQAPGARGHKGMRAKFVPCDEAEAGSHSAGEAAEGCGAPGGWVSPGAGTPQGPGCPSLTLPTEGKPISATRASPDFMTSKPSPLEEADLEGSSSWARYLASFAFSRPRWYSVAEDTSQTELSVWAGAARGPRAPAGWPDGPAAEALRRCPWLSLHLEQRPGSLLSPLNTVSRCHGGSGGGGRGTPGVSSEVAEGISRAGQGDQLPKEVTRVAQAQGEAGSGSLGPEPLLCTDRGWILCVC